MYENNINFFVPGPAIEQRSSIIFWENITKWLLMICAKLQAILCIFAQQTEEKIIFLFPGNPENTGKILIPGTENSNSRHDAVQCGFNHRDIYSPGKNL